MMVETILSKKGCLTLNKKNVILWKNAGMSDDQINEMIEFEKQLFKSRRRFYTHNYHYLITELSLIQLYLNLSINP